MKIKIFWHGQHYEIMHVDHLKNLGCLWIYLFKRIIIRVAYKKDPWEN